MVVLSQIVIISLLINYTGNFKEGDWVNFGDFRYVTSVAIDQDNVYFGTTGGVLRYDRFFDKWLDPMTITDGLPDSRIDNIAYDPSNDQIWVATPAGNAYYQPTFQRWYSAIEFPANLARNDYNPSAISILNTEFGYIYQDGIITDPQMQQYQMTKGVADGFDHLFVGTWGMGPVMINTRYSDLTLLPYGIHDNNVSMIVRVGGDFWAGTSLPDGPAPGLSRFDKQGQKWKWFVPQYTNGLASARLFSAIGDGDNVWLGTDYGVIFYRKSDDEFITYGDFASLPSLTVTSLAIDSQWVYVGTDLGVGLLNKNAPFQKRKHKKNSDSSESSADSSYGSGFLSNPKNRLQGWHINDLAIIDNSLYVATDHGALRHRLNSNIDFEFIDTPGKALSTEIIDIAQLGDTLLFLTQYDIVAVDSKTGETSKITDPSHFGTCQLRKIACLGSDIWVATNIGLWHYNINDKFPRLYNQNDGMISDDVRGVTIAGDYLWLATPRGIIRFLWNAPGRMD